MSAQKSFKEVFQEAANEYTKKNGIAQTYMRMPQAPSLYVQNTKIHYDNVVRNVATPTAKGHLKI